MPPKKGMSRGDKLNAMQQLMMDSNDVWSLKELEKDCPKKKGIPSMVVKEILQELVDNDLVSYDKIGGSNFYWCFASEACNRRKVEHDRIEKQLSDLQNEMNQLMTEIDEMKSGREDSDQRIQLEEEIEMFRKQIDDIKGITEKYDQMNPEYLMKIRKQSEIALESANRWTDNVFSCRSYSLKKLGIVTKVFNNSFEIPEEFDYIS